MNLFNFIFKKFYRLLRLNKTTEFANFPFYKNDLIGYSKPFLGNDSNEGFFTIEEEAHLIGGRYKNSGGYCFPKSRLPCYAFVDLFTDLSAKTCTLESINDR